MATINKLNKTFQSKQVLTAAEMNQLSSKIDETVDACNNFQQSAPSLPQEGGGCGKHDFRMEY